MYFRMDLTLPGWLCCTLLWEWGCGSIRPPPPVKCHITGRIGIKFVVWPHVDCVWWILWSNKGQKGHKMCQAHVKSKIQIFLNILVWNSGLYICRGRKKRFYGGPLGESDPKKHLDIKPNLKQIFDPPPNWMGLTRLKWIDYSWLREGSPHQALGIT